MGASVASGEVEVETVVGVVEGDIEQPVAVVTLENDGRSRSFVRGEPFRIRQGEETVEVGANARIVLLPERTAKGDFGELLDDPMSNWVMDHAPGDHVHTVLRGNVLKVGDRVAVLGDVDHEFDSAGGYRDSATRRIGSIAPKVIAVGEDAERLIEAWQQEDLAKRAKAANKVAAKKKRSSRAKQEALPEEALSLAPVLYFAIAALALGGAYLSMGGDGPGGERMFFAVAGLAMVDLSLFSWRRRRWMPQFHKLGSGKEGTGYRWGIAGIAMAYLMVAFATAIPAGFDPRVGLLMSAVPTVALLGLVLYMDQRGAMAGWSLLRSARLPADLPDKRFGAVEGRIAGTLSYKRRHRSETTSHQETRTDSDGRSYQTTVNRTTTYWKETTSHTDAALEVGDDSIGLRLTGAQWADADYAITYPKASSSGLGQFLRYMNDKKQREKIRNADKRGRPTLERTANAGDSALVAGRMRRDKGLEFKSTGPGSLLVFTAPAGVPARSALRTQLGMHYAGVAGFVALIALKLYWALQF